MEYIPTYKDELYLAHHGIKGMQWGVRRYENYDGTLTPAGRKKYAKYSSKYERKAGKSFKKAAIKTAVGGAAALATRKNPYLYKATPYIVGATAASAGASAAKGAYRKSKSKSYMKAVSQNKRRKAGAVEKGIKLATGAALLGGTAYALHKTGKDKDLIESINNRLNKNNVDISTKVSGIKERLHQQANRAKSKISKNPEGDISNNQKSKPNHSSSDAIREANTQASKTRNDARQRVSNDIREANAKASRARAAAEKQKANDDIFAQQVESIRKGVAQQLNTDNVKRAVSNAPSRVKKAIADKREASKTAKAEARYAARRNRTRSADDTAGDINRAKQKVAKAKRVYGAVKSAKNANLISQLRNMDMQTIMTTADILNQAGVNPNTVQDALNNAGSRAKTAVVNRVKRRR